MLPSLIRLSILFAGLVALPLANAQQSLRELLMGSRWQYGLYGNVKRLPIGLAFQRGITATVLTFNPDGSMRLDIPCKNEEFLRKVGGEFHIGGSWQLSEPNELTLKPTFRGETKTEKVLVVVDEDVLVFESPTGTKRLGKFNADVSKPCTYE